MVWLMFPINPHRSGILSERIELCPESMLNSLRHILIMLMEWLRKLSGNECPREKEDLSVVLS